MKEIGESFRIARCNIGLSKEEVVKDLNITLGQLDNLEDGNANAFKDIFFLKDLVKKYDMTYVDIHDMFLANDNYLPKKLEIHPTTLGYKAMAKSVISLIDKKTLAK